MLRLVFGLHAVVSGGFQAALDVAQLTDPGPCSPPILPAFNDLLELIAEELAAVTRVVGVHSMQVDMAQGPKHRNAVNGQSGRLRHRGPD